MLYKLTDAKDRLFISFVTFLLVSWILRTAIVSGSGGTHRWRMKTREYLLTDTQDIVARSLIVLLAVLALICLQAIIQVIVQWYKQHNSI